MARLIRITAPHFCAGMVVGERTAPIINYMRHWSFDQIKNYCDKKNWHIAWLDD